MLPVVVGNNIIKTATDSNSIPCIVCNRDNSELFSATIFNTRVFFAPLLSIRRCQSPRYTCYIIRSSHIGFKLNRKSVVASMES